MSIILMFLIGAYLMEGNQLLAVVLTGVIAVLLHFKPALHGFVNKIGASDLKAIMQFVLITLVILPVLPNENVGPYQVLNPREIWWMVVLIVGDRKSTRLNSSHYCASRMPSYASNRKLQIAAEDS